MLNSAGQCLFEKKILGTTAQVTGWGQAEEREPELSLEEMQFTW